MDLTELLIGMETLDSYYLKKIPKNRDFKKDLIKTISVGRRGEMS